MKRRNIDLAHLALVFVLFVLITGFIYMWYDAQRDKGITCPKCHTEMCESGRVDALITYDCPNCGKQVEIWETR